MVVTEEFIEDHYPLHWLVWNNRATDLEAAINNPEFEKSNIDKLDPRGRTPLLLAVVLGHAESVQVLLQHGADAQFEHKTGWNVVSEAICGGNPSLVLMVLAQRDMQKRRARGHLVPNLLRQLQNTPDYFVEMKWEFTSWSELPIPIPLLTRMCPTNTHRIYKMGSNVRIDSTIFGFEDSTLRKSEVSIIFQGQDDCVRMLEVDHTTRQVFTSVILSGNEKDAVVPDTCVYERSINRRLSNPVIISYINLDKITFERNKSGLWGWGGDKAENVNNYECKVFGASNVELITKLRHEHLCEKDKHRHEPMSNIQRFLSTFGSVETSEGCEGTGANSGKKVTYDEYFDPELPTLGGRDIGRPKEMRTKINKFKANLWLSEDYPLNLQEQVMPIVDIMALSSSQFSKLKDFIQMQIPAGFPLKIEIPMYHLVNASITFRNIFATQEDVSGVSYIREESGRLSCILDEALFEPPPLYEIRNSINPGPMTTSDGDLFQWTVEEEEDLSGEASAAARDQSKMVDIYEALNAPRTLIKDSTPDSDAEEQLLQRAIEESIIMARRCELPGWKPFSEGATSDETRGAAAAAAAAIGVGAGAIGRPARVGRTTSFDELQAVMDLSRRETEESERLLREEDEALKRVLELSLTEQ